MCSGKKKENEISLKQFESGNSQVLLISYDTFRKYTSLLNKLCDLIICDEGHKLKNLEIKTTQSINGLNCKRRIMLTGTPLQNSLAEFYACVTLVNPGILGTLQTFNRVYAEAIIKGQDPTASEEVRDLA